MIRTALRIFSAAALVASAIAFTSPGRAQTPSTVPPYNTDLGALVTNSLRGAGTVYSATQTNLDKTGVVCMFLQTVSSGSPSTTFFIQQYDAANATWFTVLESDAITGAAPSLLAVSPAIQISSLPSGYKAIGVVLPRTWRVGQTIGGTAGYITGRIGCNATK